MPPIKRDRYIWFNKQNDRGFAGKLTPVGVFEILYHYSGGTNVVVLIEKESGKAVEDGGPLINVGFVTTIINAAAAAGVVITEVVTGEVVELNETVPNWEEYEILD